MLKNTLAFDASAVLRPYAPLLEKATQPIQTANGLPNACYRDPGVFAAESEVVLQRGWAGLAHVADVPNCYDVKVCDFLGMPLILVRDGDDRIRVFHNVCRHRGMILVDNDTNTRVLRCRYHSWTYGLDGALRQTPHLGGHGHSTHKDFDPSCAGLKEVRSAVIFGTVFINLSGNAAPFEDYIATVSDRWSDFIHVPMHATTTDCAFFLDVACNWKLAVENYCEAYHLPFVHPELNRNSRLEDHYNIESTSYAGQGSHDYNNPATSDGRNFPIAKGLSSFWQTGSEYLAVFPNVLLGAHKDHFFSIVLEPLDAGRTREHIQLYYFDPSACKPEYQTMRAELKRFWRTVFEEDIFAIESMQEGRRSPAYDGGIFSPVMDGPTATFHRWIANKLISEPEPLKRKYHSVPG